VIGSKPGSPNERPAGACGGHWHWCRTKTKTKTTTTATTQQTEEDKPGCAGPKANRRATANYAHFALGEGWLFEFEGRMKEHEYIHGRPEDFVLLAVHRASWREQHQRIFGEEGCF
jgi:hypothetical protein